MQSLLFPLSTVIRSCPHSSGSLQRPFATCAFVAYGLCIGAYVAAVCLDEEECAPGDERIAIDVSLFSVSGFDCSLRSALHHLHRRASRLLISCLRSLSFFNVCCLFLSQFPQWPFCTTFVAVFMFLAPPLTLPATLLPPYVCPFSRSGFISSTSA